MVNELDINVLLNERSILYNEFTEQFIFPYVEIALQVIAKLNHMEYSNIKWEDVLLSENRTDVVILYSFLTELENKQLMAVCIPMEVIDSHDEQYITHYLYTYMLERTEIPKDRSKFH